MKKLIVFSCVLILFSCSKESPSVYPFEISPYIEFEGIEYLDSDVDTLILSFIVWDQEEDIGLTSTEVSYPYHSDDLIIDANSNPVNVDGQFQPPFFRVPLEIHTDFSNDTSYFIIDEQLQTLFSESDLEIDPFCHSINLEGTAYYALPNENHFNFVIDFHVNQSLIDFSELFNFCVDDFNGRIPLVEVGPANPIAEGGNNPFTVTYHGKFARRIEYKMLSQAFKIVFQDHEAFLRFKVKDRELNESNIVDSDIFTLDEITID